MMVSNVCYRYSSDSRYASYVIRCYYFFLFWFPYFHRMQHSWHLYIKAIRKYAFLLMNFCLFVCLLVCVVIVVLFSILTPPPPPSRYEFDLFCLLWLWLNLKWSHLEHTFYRKHTHIPFHSSSRKQIKTFAKNKTHSMRSLSFVAKLIQENTRTFNKHYQTTNKIDYILSFFLSPFLCRKSLLLLLFSLRLLIQNNRLLQHTICYLSFHTYSINPVVFSFILSFSKTISLINWYAMRGKPSKTRVKHSRINIKVCHKVRMAIL